MDHAVAMERSVEQCQLSALVNVKSRKLLSDQDHEHTHDEKPFQILYNVEAK
jgi:hypothetical protein